MAEPVKTGVKSDLASEIKAGFDRDGYFFPVRIMDAGQANDYRSRFESLEPQIFGMKLGNKNQLNYGHLLFPFVHEIVSSQALLDAVETLIGPDILVWGTTFFNKEPHTESYVSWHQDLRYWGLDESARTSLVSAWLALVPVNRENGCMRFVPGSHRMDLVEHKDTFDETNFLTRGQEAQVEVDEDATVDVVLEAGEVSFHHGHLLHASSANHSDRRRIGLVMNFVAPHVRQVVGKRDFGMLVRGEDKYGNFELIPAPEEDLSELALQWHRHIMVAHNEALYDGAEAPAA